MEMWKFSIENDVFIPPATTMTQFSKELFQFSCAKNINWLPLIMIHTLCGLNSQITHETHCKMQKLFVLALEHRKNYDFLSFEVDKNG